MKLPFRDFWSRVDRKIWRVHLLMVNDEVIWESMSTERNKELRQSHF